MSRILPKIPPESRAKLIVAVFSVCCLALVAVAVGGIYYYNTQSNIQNIKLKKNDDKVSDKISQKKFAIIKTQKQDNIKNDNHKFINDRNIECSEVVPPVTNVRVDYNMNKNIDCSEGLFTIKDAVTCNPIGNAKVELNIGDSHITSVLTDSNGCAGLSFELLEHIADDILTINIQKKGYIPLKYEAKIIMGILRETRFFLSKQLPLDTVRFVLQWEPLTQRDLDLHLQTEEEDGYHISYNNVLSIENIATLDRDSIDGECPETITLKYIDPNKEYRLFASNNSENESYTGNIIVYAYKNNQIDKIVKFERSIKNKASLLFIEDKRIKEYIFF